MTAVVPRFPAFLLSVQSVALLFGCGGDEAAQPLQQHSPGCVAPAGVSNQPESIAQTVTLIEALPKPLTLPCFIEALGRPLRLHASQSEFSAQPAFGARSPRVFLFLGANIMTIVPTGPGAHLLEFGEQRADFRSLKAEIAFPVTEPITAEAPFRQVMFNDELTNCAFCHAEEVLDPNVTGTKAFVSRALRPVPRSRVALDVFRRERELCSPASEPERCAMLEALFGWGQTEEQDFPPDMPTFQ